jgi:hypothetical protein
MKSKLFSIFGVTAIRLGALMAAVGLVASGVGIRNAQAQIIIFPRTYLLFPLLITQDTGEGSLAHTIIFISNTSADPLGTTPEAGECTIYFYGSNAPSSPLSTGTIAAGTTYVADTAAVAPGFQGYAIATCNFRYAHGVAMFGQQGSNFVAYPGTYLALVIQTPRLNDEGLNN